MKMPELPPIPVGDRFEDVNTFRHLGRGGSSQLFECWDDAIRAYALAYGEMVCEECEKAVSEVAREWFEHDGRMSEGGKAVCAAIRRKD